MIMSKEKENINYNKSQTVLLGNKNKHFWLKNLFWISYMYFFCFTWEISKMYAE